MDAKIKEMIDKRQEANREILEFISKDVEKYSDLRFGQILAKLKIVDYADDFENGGYRIKDPFNEESVITLQRMKNNNVL